jgi:hypothetical protein
MLAETARTYKERKWIYVLPVPKISYCVDRTSPFAGIFAQGVTA